MKTWSQSQKHFICLLWEKSGIDNYILHNIVNNNSGENRKRDNMAHIQNKCSKRTSQTVFNNKFKSQGLCCYDCIAAAGKGYLHFCDGRINAE